MSNQERGFCDSCGYEEELYKRKDGKRFFFHCKARNPL